MAEMRYFCPTCEHKGDDSGLCKSCANTGTAIPSNYEVADNRPSKPETEVKGDTVNHPDHYKNGKYECIEVMVEIFGVEATQIFCQLNAFKYLWRCDHKKKKVEDIKKAHWYLSEYLKLESERNGDQQ